MVGGNRRIDEQTETVDVADGRSREFWNRQFRIPARTGWGKNSAGHCQNNSATLQQNYEIRISVKCFSTSQNQIYELSSNRFYELPDQFFKAFTPKPHFRTIHKNLIFVRYTKTWFELGEFSKIPHLSCSAPLLFRTSPVASLSLLVASRPNFERERGIGNSETSISEF